MLCEFSDANQQVETISKFSLKDIDQMLQPMSSGEKNNLANTADLKLQSSLHQAFQEDSGKSKLLAYLL